MPVSREARVLEKLEKKALKGKDLRWSVIGAGNGGLAMAGHLGIMGYPVSLYNRSEERLIGVRWHGGVKIEGDVEGFGPVDLASSEMGEAIEGADVIMIVTPANAHAPLAGLMAPLLQDGQVIILNPGRTGGAFEFSHTLQNEGIKTRPIIAEAQTFIYASRAVSRHRARIFRIKNEVALASLPSWWTPHILKIVKDAFPQFVAGGNVLSTSMENIGAVFHPALTILNTGWIEASNGNFDYYTQGITPSIAKILEKVDAERLSVARALGVRSVTAREWLYLTYDSPGKNLYEAIQNTIAYRGIKAPASINHRYIWEDIPMSLVPLSSIGNMLGSPTPTLDMVIDLASILHDRDYRAIGRTVESLGIAGLNIKEIHRIVADPKKKPGGKSL